MAFNFQPPNTVAKFIIIAEFILVAYLLFSLVSSVYRSYQFDLYIKKFEADNARIEELHHKLLEDFEYYTSEAYQEKYAKENLNLTKPGEEVIIVPGELFDNSGIGKSFNQEDQSGRDLSIPQKWWDLFFGEI